MRGSNFGDHFGSHFDWEDVRHFIAFAEQGSLAAAARTLKVEHATVSRRIVALEQALQVRLLDRRARRHVLSMEGQRVLQAAQVMQAQAWQLTRIARAEHAQGPRDITISAPPALSNALIAPRVASFMVEHPDLRLCLLSEKRAASLHQREADIALRLFRPKDKQLVVKKIATLRFGFYGAMEYLASHSVDAYGFIGYDNANDGLPQQSWIKVMAAQRPIVFVSSELEVHWTAARHGVGIAALPCVLADADPLLQPIAVPNYLPHKTCQRELWLVVHQDLRRAKDIRAAMRFLQTCFAS